MISNDGATILRQMEVIHPTARMVRSGFGVLGIDWRSQFANWTFEERTGESGEKCQCKKWLETFLFSPFSRF